MSHSAESGAYYRGRPILVASGLTNDAGLNTAPLYAVDFAYVFMVSSGGEPENYCIQSRRLGLQNDGNAGIYQWFHGACVIRHPRALTRTTVTTTLGA